MANQAREIDRNRNKDPRLYVVTGLMVLWLAGLGGITLLLAQEAKGKLEFSKVDKGGQTSFYARNLDPGFPIHLQYDFTLSGHFRFSAPLPGRIVIPPGQKALLGNLMLDPGPGGSSYQSNDDYGFGDPGAVPDPKAAYLFPYEHGVKHGIVQGYYGKVTHMSCQCLDFDLAENSPICAARDGLVVMVKQDSDVGGPGPEFRDKGNFVWILHADGSWAQYGHLRKDGARVRLGQRVRAGQVIGLSGHTGQAQGPHLHFEVDQATWGATSTTIPTKFLVQGGQWVDPVEGKYYYSFHPGGPAFKEIKAENLTEESLEGASAKAPVAGAVTIRTERVDSKTILYGSNGTAQDRTMTLQFPSLQNLSCSKALPYTKVIPAGKEVYLLSLDRIDTEQRSAYNVNYSYR